MTNKKLLLTCVVALLFSLLAIATKAQDPPANATASVSPEKLALIRELMELASSKKTIDAMLKAQAEEMEKQLPEIIWQAVSGMKELESLTPAQRDEIRSQVVSSSVRTGRRLYEALLERIDFNKLIEDISVPLHDKYFTESELRDLVAFYKSPTGKKVIEVMPNLAVESMTRTSEIIMPKVADMIRKIQEEETQLMTKQIQEKVKTKEKSTKRSGRTPRRRSPH